MTSTTPEVGRGKLLLVAAIFVGPLLLAAILYLGGYGASQGPGTNHGVLLEPISHLPDFVSEPDVAGIAGGGWLLVYINTGPCDEACREALYRLRQSRLMLANEMERVTRLFLHGEQGPDTVFLSEQHKGLKTIRSNGLGELMVSKRPAQYAGGGFYLIDPLGNLVMYFPPELNPRDMVEDLKHLLELSRIG